MMRRIWLAVLLGVILGLGVTVIPSSTSSTSAKPMLVTAGTAERQPPLATTTSSWLPLQFLLVGLLAGLALAAPVFILMKYRG